MGKLKTEDKKRYQLVSRITGIIFRIGNICAWIGVVGCLMGAGVVAMIAPNIEVNSETKTIKIFDEEQSYKIENNTVELGEGATITLGNEAIDFINKFLEEDLGKILNIATVSLFVLTILIALIALELGHGARIFKNIAEEDTPFTEENTERIDKVFKLMLAGVILAFALDMFVMIVSGGSFNFGIEGTSITGLLCIYILSYVFKSGLENQPVKKLED